MNDTSTLGARSLRWRKAKGYSCDPGWVTAKLLEEAGEVAKAVIGEFENRSGRGDVLKEAAQAVVLLATLVELHHPGADLYAAVDAEMHVITHVMCGKSVIPGVEHDCYAPDPLA